LAALKRDCLIGLRNRISSDRTGCGFAWLRSVDETKFAISLNQIRDLDPVAALSLHVPPARAMLPQLLDTLAEAPRAPALAEPNQAALQAMLAPMTQGAPPVAAAPERCERAIARGGPSWLQHLTDDTRWYRPRPRSVAPAPGRPSSSR
jgi:hypothetical protein